MYIVDLVKQNLFTCAHISSKQIGIEVSRYRAPGMNSSHPFDDISVR
jgi:hypothetical protein